MTAHVSSGARSRSLIAAVAALALCAVGGVLDPVQFYRSWLLAWLFWAGVALGCLAILMIQHITGGAWGVLIRRVLEAATRTLPWLALLFLPVAFGMTSLYPWARPEVMAADELLRHKAAYLNVPFFMARAAVYFAAWCVMAWWLSRMSARMDRSPDPKLTRHLVLFSAGGLLVFVLTMTFASVDWVMSLEPHWTSTIYGPLTMAAQAVSAFCFAIIVTVLAARSAASTRTAGLVNALRPDLVHDLGKLLFAFVMVWAYFALSQFLIIWSANLPEEIPWYIKRLGGGWQWVGLAIIVLHFALPFGLLLMRRVKRSSDRLLRVTMLIFVMRAVDSWWMISPAFDAAGLRPHWLDLAAMVGVGGLWVHLFLRQLDEMPLLPANDPQLQEALGHG